MHVSIWHGYTAWQWADLPELVKVDKRESYQLATGIRL